MVSSTPQQSTAPYGAVVAPRKITPRRLQEMRDTGEKIVMLTAYDAVFAGLAGQAGVDVVLVGDSLGMVCQGRDSTVPVTMDDMVYHTQAVARGLSAVGAASLLLSDMPFGSYHGGPDDALRHAVRLMQAGAHMVKLEGGGWTAPLVRFLVERGVPVCAHLGLTPQTVHALSGYRVQGRDEQGAALLERHSRELADAGATMLVLEMVPAALSARITAALPACHTIGIGAGSGTAGQVLVMHDMLGASLGKTPRFVKNFLAGNAGVREAFEAYAQAVRAGRFPEDSVHAW
ncbi:3-methyl-2-oxobutanoate hydroxymethyltransferase [Bordetella holmesii]|uniref:3-methyl-2-oxobutanoate hydroxymethyltransferase n=2 Tax=Bordetella holmesii TaxID=35814 RepID=A0A158M4B6_9BORD|nr:3-methyl-2-oxobutanoate hydroxymethyltransferase [Bordetella holmesii]AMD45378.1 3-methyl-2-oxobutanoate hydroxymethyltransferase [Bordetella holmesii H558]AMD49197.1 3-methyl-2-oxobutanoate hydroxymethyltransferase [Bordetella holmesii F627]AOB34266.1 3-methyl-2-oxobutanoate hydroxymethyltransferase [Bordetella holmesii]AUL18281.1 3-methyl-2-oxobutanoate hydroxymethyltransferase [Bordetella holmesii]AUL21594.1 3-methyl-2-oxobutanoate hydroxymethyltransferase [Bordetella holmesii]